MTKKGGLQRVWYGGRYWNMSSGNTGKIGNVCSMTIMKQSVSLLVSMLGRCAMIRATTDDAYLDQEGLSSPCNWTTDAAILRGAEPH